LLVRDVEGGSRIRNTRMNPKVLNAKPTLNPKPSPLNPKVLNAKPHEMLETVCVRVCMCVRGSGPHDAKHMLEGLGFRVKGLGFRVVLSSQRMRACSDSILSREVQVRV
jgi:hypothetical protein